MAIFPSLCDRQIRICLSSLDLASLLKLFLCSFDKLFCVRCAFNSNGFMFLNLVQTISTYLLVSSSILPLSGLENLGIFNFCGNTKSPSFFSPSTALHSVFVTCCWAFSHSAFSTDWLQLGVGQVSDLCIVKHCRGHLVGSMICLKSVFAFLPAQPAFCEFFASFWSVGYL